MRKLPKVDIEFLAQRDGLVCGICGESLIQEYDNYMNWKKFGKKTFQKRKLANINRDHILPKSKGGKWTPENLQLTHKTCNSDKGNICG